MRRLITCSRLLIAVGVLAAGASTAAANPGTLGLTEGGGAQFPDRSFVLTLPSGMRLTPQRVHVLENGNTVSRVSIVPAAAAGREELALVLMIDASNSMRGSAIAGAMSAARAFATQRNPSQQLAVITFNRQPHVLLPFTTEQGEIEAALSHRPALAQGTHVYDAVESALALLRDAHIASGSLVVLSDGSDTGSRATLATVAALGRSAHVRIFSVGLRSASFSPPGLLSLAEGTGGAYSEATSPAQLARIYEELGAQLASEYLVRYRSSAGPGAKVRVFVRVDGIAGSAVSGYSTPALPDTTRPPFHRSFGYRFWRSALSMVFVSLLSAGLLALGISAVVGPRNRSLRKRMSEFVSVVSPEDASASGPALTGKVLVGAERSLERTQWWARFKEELELAEIRIPAVQIALWTFVGTVLAGWLLAAVGRSPLFSVFGLAVPFGVRSLVRRKLERKRRLFAEQLPDNLQVLASALRAGHSLVAALSVVVDDAPEPSRSEFRRVVADEQLGVSLEDAMGVVVRRMGNRDLEQVAVVAALQRRTGGNTAEVLDRVTETIRERYELRRMVKTLTAQGRISRWIVSFLPAVLLLAITALNSKYMEPLLMRPGGRALLAFATVMVVAGSLVIKRIVNIKV